MAAPRLGIVAEGHDNLLESGEYQAASKRITREVEDRFLAEMTTASFWRRLWLKWRIHRAVSRELRKAFPPDALYAAMPDPTAESRPRSNP